MQAKQQIFHFCLSNCHSNEINSLNSFHYSFILKHIRAHFGRSQCGIDNISFVKSHLNHVCNISKDIMGRIFPAFQCLELIYFEVNSKIETIFVNGHLTSRHNLHFCDFSSCLYRIRQPTHIVIYIVNQVAFSYTMIQQLA